MFDTFLSCLSFAVIFNLVGIGLQIAVMGFDRYCVVVEYFGVSLLRCITGLNFKLAFVSLNLIITMLNALMIWAWWPLVFCSVINLLIGLVFALKVRKELFSR